MEHSLVVNLMQLGAPKVALRDYCAFVACVGWFPVDADSQGSDWDCGGLHI